MKGCDCCILTNSLSNVTRLLLTSHSEDPRLPYSYSLKKFLTIHPALHSGPLTVDPVPNLALLQHTRMVRAPLPEVVPCAHAVAAGLHAAQLPRLQSYRTLVRYPPGVKGPPTQRKPVATCNAGLHQWYIERQHLHHGVP
jgi:hypothetical protein